MLRHLKMELKRQEQEAMASQTGAGHQQLVSSDVHQHKEAFNELDQGQQRREDRPRRVRGRRSSKPAMEKRRRARINQCLDILKSYVLTDEDNLSQLGIDTSQSENQDEETIARTILKSSGLINRHRGRKNPNKLEKADILELTVDYVRRLHEQRDAHWLQPPTSATSTNLKTPLHLQLTAPLTQQAQAQAQAANLPSPPPSSASNSPQPLLSISRNNLISDVLDLSENSKRNKQFAAPDLQNVHYRDGLILIETSQGCWRPWHAAAASAAMPSSNQQQQHL